MNELTKFGTYQMILQNNGVDKLIVLNVEGEQAIVNPFLTECGRRDVNPVEYYGKDVFNEWKVKAEKEILVKEKEIEMVLSHDNMVFAINLIKFHYKAKNEKSLYDYIKFLAKKISESEDLFNEYCENYPFSVSFDEFAYEVEDDNTLDKMDKYLESDISKWELSVLKIG